jgi:hypothetical protein
LFSLIPSQKLFLNKTITLKIGNPESTGSHGKYMKYFSFPWPAMMAAHDLEACTSTE